MIQSLHKSYLLFTPIAAGALMLNSAQSLLLRSVVVNTSLRIYVEKFKLDVIRLVRITKEAWDFDRRKGTIIILERVLASICRYLETGLDALLLTQSTHALQLQAPFCKHSFARLVLLKLILTALKYGIGCHARSIINSVEASIGYKREYRLLNTYLSLPYPQQVKKGLNNRFVEVFLPYEQLNDANLALGPL
jgi:hypothetical protein